MKGIIITHGDLDGVLSGVLLHDVYKDDFETLEVVFSQPYWLAKMKYIGDLSLYDKIFIADIALDNRDITSVMRFIQKYKDKLVWYDHHQGWSDTNLLQTVKFSHFIDEKEKSCVSLIKKVHKKHTFSEKILEVAELAHRTDQGDINNIYHKALKINPKNQESRYEIFRYCISVLGGEQERQSIASIIRKSKYYMEVMYANTLKVLAKDSIIKRNVIFIDIRNYGKYPIDKTLLFFKAYELAPYCVLKFKTRDRQSCLTIATNTRLNLIRAFRQKSGQPYRITLFKPRLSDEKIIDIINQ